jgi:hypothetical protein
MTGRLDELSGGKQASAAVERATRVLLARQDSRGRWSGRSAGDVSLNAEALLVREFLGARTAEATSAAAQQIRSVQQPDGSWIGGPEPGGTGDLSASALAYLALRLAGDSPGASRQRGLSLDAGWPSSGSSDGRKSASRPRSLCTCRPGMHRHADSGLAGAARWLSR